VISNASIVWNSKVVLEGLAEISRSRGYFLEYLKNLLDSYHGIARSHEYYDLVAGDWLEHFAHHVYVAWREVLVGNVPSTQTTYQIPGDLIEAQQFSLNEDYHQYLRSMVMRLLEGADLIPDSLLYWKKRISIISGSGTKRTVSMLRGLATKSPQLMLTYPGYKCQHAEWVLAIMKWRRWLAWDDLQYQLCLSADINYQWRKKMAVTTVDSFANIVTALMPLFLPSAILEGFEDYRNAVLSLPLIRPNALYSSRALSSHLVFKVLAAEWRQEGTKLLYHQGGGGYGIEPLLAMEDYEIRVSDRYYSWGWDRPDRPVYQLSPATPSYSKRLQAKYKLLLNCVDFPKVPHRLQCLPMPGTIETMHRRTCDFLTFLPDRRGVLIRPYPHDYGWGFTDNLRKAAPEAIFDNHRKRSITRFAESRLVVHNYLGTAWLETLALNIPTVCFYDSDAYAFRTEVQPWIDTLEQLGILHQSGKSAAQFFVSLNNDPEGWWDKREVQEARQNFIARYANFSPDWKLHWEREFELVLD